jgi:hypothetical protein
MIMKYIKSFNQAWKKVYANKLYVGVSVVFALLIFSFNTVINNYSLLLNEFSFSLLFTLIGGSTVSMTKSSLVLIVLMSVLAGIVLSFSLYLLKRQFVTAASAATAGSSGLLVSILTPACPSCAIGFLSVLGLGGFLGLLPFKGLELSFLGLGILVYSLVFLSGKINSTLCERK